MPEEKTGSPFDFLRSKPVMAVSVLLVAEIALFYAVPAKEYIPSPPPLEQFATDIGPWRTVRQIPVDAYTQSFLRADDTLMRDYAGPGNGWTPESSQIISVGVPGKPAPIPGNRFVVTHDEQRSLVMYWYQNPRRVTANEYLSKFYLIFDALRYRRSDEALIRVIVHMRGNVDPGTEEHAESRCFSPRPTAGCLLQV